MRLFLILFISVNIFVSTHFDENYAMQSGDITTESIYWMLQKEIPYPIINYPDYEMRQYDPQAVKWKINFPSISMNKKQVDNESKILQNALTKMNRLVDLCEKQYKSYSSQSDYFSRHNSNLNTQITSGKAINASKAKLMLYDLIGCVEDRLDELGYSSSSANVNVLTGVWTGSVDEGFNTFKIVALFNGNSVTMKMYMNLNLVNQSKGKCQLLDDGTIKIKYDNGDAPEGSLQLVDENTIEYISNQYQFSFYIYKE